MTAPGGTFHIQSKLQTPFPHHKSFKALWETKWRKPCEMGVYPFMFGSIHDFEPIVEDLVARDMKEPYNWDDYAASFFPKAEELVSNAKKAEEEGNTAKASELFLRASAVYRISRFPAPRSAKQREAWTKGKEVCLRGLKLREHPIEEVYIPHVAAGPKDGAVIPAYYHLPVRASPTSPVPLILILTGLDGYRTELAVWIDGWRRKGCACLVLEIPGTGDCPADASDPTSPDRLFDSIFAWISTQDSVAQDKIVVWAFSTGGFYAIRLAHTHPTKCAGIVALGGGCHYMFHPDWLEASNHLEYPFDLGRTLACKFGYADFELFKEEAMGRFSLVKDGTLARACGRLLLVNGTEDSIFPIDDYYEALMHGSTKEVRFVSGKAHMGEPESFVIILGWIYKVLGIEGQPGEQLKLLPFKAQY